MGDEIRFKSASITVILNLCNFSTLRIRSLYPSCIWNSRRYLAGIHRTDDQNTSLMKKKKIITERSLWFEYLFNRNWKYLLSVIYWNPIKQKKSYFHIFQSLSKSLTLKFQAFFHCIENPAFPIRNPNLRRGKKDFISVQYKLLYNSFSKMLMMFLSINVNTYMKSKTMRWAETIHQSANRLIVYFSCGCSNPNIIRRYYWIIEIFRNARPSPSPDRHMHNEWCGAETRISSVRG